MKNNQRLKWFFKILIAFIICFLIFLFLFGIAFNKWNSSDPRMQQRELRDKYKMIIYKNHTDSIYMVITYFMYTIDDMDRLQIDTLSPFNEKTTSYISTDYSDKISIPIIRNNSVPFPESFKIDIYNKSGIKLYKSIDSKLFEMVAIPEDSGVINILEANIWTLVIDSALLYGSK